MAHPHDLLGSGGWNDIPSTSSAFINRLRQNDPQAWDRMAQVYYPLVVHWCRRRLPAEDVLEVVHDVFIAVHSGIARFRFDGPENSFRGWLRGIATNRSMDYWRNRAKQGIAAGGSEHLRWMTHHAAESESAPTDEQERDETAIIVRGTLRAIRDEFSTNTWQAFERTAIHGDRVVDVASDLQMTPNAVTKAKSRVLKRLRQELGELIE